MAVRVFAYGSLGVIVAAILAVVGVLGWFISDRALPVTVLSTEVLTTSARPGGKVLIRQRLIYHRNCGANIDRVTYDDHTHRQVLMPVRYERPPQGLGERTITFSVPVADDFEPGNGYYRAAPSYWCNPLQRYYWPIVRNDTVARYEVLPLQ